MNEGTHTDILDIRDLVGCYESDSANGGYLKIDTIADNSDGTTTLRVTLDADGTGAENLLAATIVMSSTDTAGKGVCSFIRRIFEQLVQHKDIVF